MTQGSESQTRHRRGTPVELLGRRVPGLYSRTYAKGGRQVEVFEYIGRLNGRVTTKKLAATSRTDATAEVEQLRAEARRKDRPITLDPTLTVEPLANRFRQAVEADTSYSPRTRDDLLGRVDKHIVPTLGRARVCDVNAQDVRRFARALPTMRASTHRNVLSVLSVLFAWAVSEGYAVENPVARARERFPRDLRRSDITRFEPRALTDREAQAALAQVDPTYRPLVGFIAETGARASEALAVRFGDVDLQAGTWTVAGQLAKDGTVRAAKTPGSMATVPLSKAAIAIVKKRRSKSMASGFNHATADAFVFTGRNGQPLSRYEALRHWQNATEATLGERLRLHDLRTTLASRLAANGVDVPTAQALLRHANPSTTLNTYTRVRGDAAAKLERMREALDA